MPSNIDIDVIIQYAIAFDYSLAQTMKIFRALGCQIPVLTDQECIDLCKETVFSFDAIRASFPKQEDLTSKMISARDKLPPVGKYVLIAAPSGYLGTPYRFREAKYDPDYRGWTDCAGDRITDSGEDVTHWMELPRI